MPPRRCWRVDKGLEVLHVYDIVDDQSERPELLTNKDTNFESGYICCYKTPSGRANLMLHVKVLTCRPIRHPRRHGQAAFD